MEGGPPVRIPLERLVHVDDDVAFYVLGVAPVLAVLVAENLCITVIVVVRVVGWVASDGPGVVGLVSLLGAQVFLEVGALLHVTLEDLLMVLCEADGKHLERINRSLSRERINEELVSNSTKLGTIMVNVVSTDGKLVIFFFVLAEIFEPSIACRWEFDCGTIG